MSPVLAEPVVAALSRAALIVLVLLAGAVQATLDRPDRNLRATPQPQAVEDVLDVVGRGPRRDAQPVGKLLIAESLGQADRDISLARRQPRDLFARGLPAALEGSLRASLDQLRAVGHQADPASDRFQEAEVPI